MTRSVLYLVIGVLAVVAAGTGYFYYQDQQSGIDIKIDEAGISIEAK